MWFQTKTTNRILGKVRQLLFYTQESRGQMVCIRLTLQTDCFGDLLCINHENRLKLVTNMPLTLELGTRFLHPESDSNQPDHSGQRQ